MPRTAQELLAGLRQALAAAPRPLPELGTVPLAGGLVGYTAYDVVRYFERLPEPRRPLAQCAAAPALPRAPLAAGVRSPDARHRTAPCGQRGGTQRAAERSDPGAARADADRGRRRGGGYRPPVAALSRAEYLSGVLRAQEYIAAGDAYQLVLSSRFSGLHDLDPFQAYRALRLVNPSPYMFFCELGTLTVVGSSPEALVKLTAGHAELRPIAGTRARSDEADLDAARAAELLADPKENAEHVMLVDLARNDLGRVASAGSVRVEPYRAIERYSHVMHIVSGVQGQLAAGCDAFDLFAAAFPAGTLVGAPKVRAMEIIDELEPVRRGLYGGTVGYFGARGDMDQAITIRTLVFHGDEYSYQAGAGIVADSQPEAEHDEVLAKSAAAVQALRLAEEGL